MFYSVFLFIQFCLIVKVTSQSCLTPHSQPGHCVDVYQCEELIDLLRTSTKPISNELKSLLKEFQCRSHTPNVNSMFVCCPTDNAFLKPDIARHRNLHLLPASTDCGHFDDSDRVIGGTKAEMFEFPWMALLSYKLLNGDQRFQCGGTLINSRYVLTAAHCIKRFTDKQFVGVRLGELNIKNKTDCQQFFEEEEECSGPVQDIRIEKLILHPDYNVNDTLWNDIGLVRLAEPARMGQENISPICLPINRDLINPAKMKTLIVTGWGSTGSVTFNDALLKATLPRVNLAECKAIMSRVQHNLVVTSKQICAGGFNKTDSCGGDSGGPLQAAGTFDRQFKYVQYGIVSYGPKECGKEGVPGVYTNVISYLSWILDNIEA